MSSKIFLSTAVNFREDDQQKETLPGYESEKNVVLSMPNSCFSDAKRRSFLILICDLIKETRKRVYVLAEKKQEVEEIPLLFDTKFRL